MVARQVTWRAAPLLLLLLLLGLCRLLRLLPALRLVPARLWGGGLTPPPQVPLRPLRLLRLLLLRWLPPALCSWRRRRLLRGWCLALPLHRRHGRFPQLRGQRRLLALRRRCSRE